MHYALYNLVSYVKKPWWNGSGGRAAGLIYYTLVKPEVIGSIPGVSHKFRIVSIIIPACLVR